MLRDFALLQRIGCTGLARLTPERALCEAEGLICPLCRQRKARRSCPALGHDICAVCCGTKRLVEIRCPADCVYLASSRAHPPAVVQRQHERDLRVLLPTIAGLTERQTQLFFLLTTSIGRYRTEGLQRTLDRDVADASAAQAATYETAHRGVIYEHQPDSLPGQRLQQQMKVWLKELAEGGGRALERDAAIVLRRIEAGAKEAGPAVGGGETAYLDLLARVVGQARAGANAVPGATEREGPPGTERSILELP